jgi:imidazole glycerol-phosphate synthase subunit HisF
MLKRRIIPVELLDSGRLVKTVQFGSQRDVGDPVKSSKVYSDQDADELLLMQIDRHNRSVDTLASIVAKVAEHCYVPLTAGGGITELDHARRLFVAGADKILVNSAAYRDTELIAGISGVFGCQAVVVSIDVRFEDGSYVLYSNCGREREPISLREHVSSVIHAGAGEIMVQVIDRDGMMQGYDLELLSVLVEISTVPVIAASGAGTFVHLQQAFDTKVDAVACGSLFNFGDNNPLRAKSFLKNYGIPLKRV